MINLIPSDVDNNDNFLWRYMSFSKFMNLINSESMFLPKVELFEDIFEGIHNSFEEEDYFDITNDGEIIKVEMTNDKRVCENTKKFKQIGKISQQEVIQGVGISCWHFSNHESHAMWNVFVGEDTGVCIRTSTLKLIGSLREKNPQYKIDFARVKYINFNNNKMPTDNVLNPLFFKNEYFKHEKEFRIIAYNQMIEESNKFVNIEKIDGAGLKLKFDYLDIIDEIILSPYSPAWFHGLVKDICTRKYKMNLPIKSSIIGIRKP